jgi:anti-sigma factor RsiW
MTQDKHALDRAAAFAADRELWQRCRTTEAPESDTERLLDLAAFADGMLDEEEHARVGERLAADAVARADVAAARALSVGGIAMPGGIEPIIERAISIRRSRAEPTVALMVQAPKRRMVLQGVAQWGSLAAAIALASWLGFAMGSGVSMTMMQPGPVNQISDDNFLPDMLDPSTGFLRDLGIGQQT